MNIEPRPMPPMRERDARFWRALRAGEFVGEACRQCGAVRYPTALRCPACRSAQAELRALSGRGEIVSACRFHRPYFAEFTDALPYTVIVVRLEEGPLLYANLVDEPDALPTPGERVRAVLDPLGEHAALVRFERVNA
ncbi:OB-fold domain-containing protein [Paraburkholderia sp. A1RI-2L]|uniref:Zn-ribbon domain-containing OB-fold protein n=1 Tax=Paraburkholderia sp. A1RI-2L TaxID=3028367 RepID=UPI003B79EFA7